jgi:beta-lactamase regulating signal transducer with metallopeptidase domain
LQIGVTNALVATALAVVAALVAKLARRPALSHALWLLVLLKLITPPLVVVPVEWPESEATPAAPPAVADAKQQPALAESTPVAVARLPEAKVEAVEDDADPPVVEPPSGEQPPATEQKAAIAVAPVLPAEIAAPEMPAPLAPVTTTPETTEIPWVGLLGWMWLAGSGVWFAVALVRVRRFQRQLSFAQPADTELQQEACGIAVRMGLRDCPGVWLVPGKLSPLLWAIAGYPRLLLPVGLLARLDAQQRATLLAHELAHYRRRDHWVRGIELVALGLYWWLPVVWWARRELREAEEECCDAWVVWALPDAVKAYATALVESLDFLSGPEPVLPPAASGLGHLNLLRRRLTMIMRGTKPRMLTGAGFLTVLGLAALLLPLLPTLAQPPGPKDPLAGGQDRAKGKDLESNVRDLDRAKADLKRSADELARFKAELDKMHDEYEKRARHLQRAVDAIAELEKHAGDRKDGPGLGGFGKGFGPGGPIGGMQSMDKRLAEMEKKLDAVLQELQELRKQLGRQGSGGKGGPGGSGFDPDRPPGDRDPKAKGPGGPAGERPSGPGGPPGVGPKPGHPGALPGGPGGSPPGVGPGPGIPGSLPGGPGSGVGPGPGVPRTLPGGPPGPGVGPGPGGPGGTAPGFGPGGFPGSGPGGPFQGGVPSPGQPGTPAGPGGGN